MTTISEAIGLRKEIVATGTRMISVPTAVETEERQYVGDLSNFDANAQRAHAGQLAKVEHSTFWQDSLLRMTDTPLLVRRSITWKEALKALLSKRARQFTMVALEVELYHSEIVVDDV